MASTLLESLNKVGKTTINKLKETNINATYINKLKESDNFLNNDKTFDMFYVLKMFTKNNIASVNGKVVPTSGFFGYMDDMTIIISIVIILFLSMTYFLLFFIHIFAYKTKWLENAAKYFYLPVIGLILIVAANVKFWNHKYNPLYPNVNKVFSKEISLPVIIYFMFCMTQTLVSYMIAMMNNTIDNWANFYIKYFITIIFTYMLYLFVKNDQNIFVWIFAFLPLVILFLTITYFLSLTLLSPDTSGLTSFLNSKKKDTVTSVKNK